MPTLADFFCCLWEAEGVTGAIILLHIKLLPSLLITERTKHSTNRKQGKGVKQIQIVLISRERYWRVESGKTASVNASHLLKKKIFKRLE